MTQLSFPFDEYIKVLSMIDYVDNYAKESGCEPGYFVDFTYDQRYEFVDLKQIIYN